MACAKYKDWLSDAALGALDAAREVELCAHVAGCEACRAALESEQALFAAMDAGLESSVAAEPSPEFVARVRMRVAEQAVQRPSWMAGWLPLTASAVAVVLLLVVWFIPRGAQQPSETQSPIAQKPTAPQAIQVSAGAVRRVETAPAGHVAIVATTGNRVPRSAEEPEILVPAGQWMAVLRLYEGVHRGRVNADSLLKPVPEELPLLEELKVPELSIPKIEINGHSGSPEKTDGESGK